jgi:hypothetical protein
MEATKVQIKLYATREKDAELSSYIPVFHRWVRDSVPDEMVFDVADYTHVPWGMGVLLVGHAADYALDQGEGRPGILYSRKRDLPEGAPLVEDALRRALQAAKTLDGDAEVRGPKGFSSDEILIRFPDRLHLKNDDASFDKVKAAVEEALKALLPDCSYSLSRVGEVREPLTVRAQI